MSTDNNTATHVLDDEEVYTQIMTSGDSIVFCHSDEFEDTVYSDPGYAEVYEDDPLKDATVCLKSEDDGKVFDRKTDKTEIGEKE